MKSPFSHELINKSFNLVRDAIYSRSLGLNFVFDEDKQTLHNLFMQQKIQNIFIYVCICKFSTNNL